MTIWKSCFPQKCTFLLVCCNHLYTQRWPAAHGSVVFFSAHKREIVKGLIFSCGEKRNASLKSMSLGRITSVFWFEFIVKYIYAVKCRLWNQALHFRSRKEVIISLFTWLMLLIIDCSGWWIIFGYMKGQQGIYVQSECKETKVWAAAVINKSSSIPTKSTVPQDTTITPLQQTNSFFTNWHWPQKNPYSMTS